MVRPIVPLVSSKGALLDRIVPMVRPHITHGVLKKELFFDGMLPMGATAFVPSMGCQRTSIACQTDLAWGREPHFSGITALADEP
ncbi:MAG: hypothetical protein IPN38_17815 [Flavobacteriales bacterium]|nr:hypothetical protein [Flavobacteriales bacterium]